MKSVSFNTAIYIFISLCAMIQCIPLSDSSEQNNHHQLRRVPTVSPQVLAALRTVPEWIRNYAAWHKEQRLHHLHDPETKFLTVTCHKDYGCGGLSDRIRPLPFFILAANKTGRVLFIHWQKFSLEDFLVPPEGGLDWTLPKEFEDLGDKAPGRQMSCVHWNSDRPERRCQHLWNHTNPARYETKNIVINAREDLYADFKDEYFVTKQRPEGTYGAVMNLLFEPSEGVKMLFRDTLRRLGLRPKQYLAAHFRGEYPNFNRNKPMSLNHKKHLIQNAIDCVVHISGNKNLPIYFTSDNAESVSYLLNDSPYSQKNNPPVKVVGVEDFNRINLDVKVNVYKGQPKDFYSIFVDLLMFANSKCVSHGVGGYGLFGARMADERCMIQHQVAWNPTDCPSLV